MQHPHGLQDNDYAFTRAVHRKSFLVPIIESQIVGFLNPIIDTVVRRVFLSPWSGNRYDSMIEEKNVVVVVVR